MSMNQEDRDLVERGTMTILFYISITAVIVFAYGFTALGLMRDNGSMLDDLCRAHYPECILETTP